MGLFPKATYPYDLGLPVGPNSNCYFVDPTNGDDDYKGTCPEKAMKTVAAAEARCTANQNDAVVLIGISAANPITETLVWDKNFTHLVGLSANLPGVGQRCRLTAGATDDLVEIMTISGTGCIFRNLQLANGADAAVDSGAATVTANRCEFKNVFFHGIGNAAIVGIRAGAYSLTLTGAHENLFEDCTIGADTIVRAAANAELVMSAGSSKNTFNRCNFMSAASTAGKFMVSMDIPISGCGLNSFKECLFYNNSTNWATEVANAFSITGAGGTYYIDLYRCRLVGVTAWSTVVTHMYSGDPIPDAGFGVAVQPTS